MNILVAISEQEEICAAIQGSKESFGCGHRHTIVTSVEELKPLLEDVRSGKFEYMLVRLYLPTKSNGDDRVATGALLAVVAEKNGSKCIMGGADDPRDYQAHIIEEKAGRGLRL